MKWEKDLTKDIRVGDSRDFSDNAYNLEFPEVKWRPIRVTHPTEGYEQTMTVCNMESIKSTFDKVKHTAKCIVEIGVDCNGTPTQMTATRVFLDNKKDDTVYIGVDINDKSYLDDTEKNIYTIKTSSSNIEQVMDFIRSKGVNKIDYLFIDGDHSINQVLIEWEYTQWLADDGIVGFHDTSVHPGPHMFVKYLNRDEWEVIENACSDDDNDYGVGFAWRK